MLRPLCAALALLFVTACADTSGVTRLGNPDEIRLRQLDAVNAVRESSGLTPLQMSGELNAAAETHARDMYVQQRAWHFGSDLTSPRERAFRAGYQGELVGENLSEGTDSDMSVLESWLKFSDTRAIMMDPSGRGLGLGWYQEPNSNKTWWVQLVGQ